MMAWLRWGTPTCNVEVGVFHLGHASFYYYYYYGQTMDGWEGERVTDFNSEYA